MTKYAILGYGTVGRGVAEVMEEQRSAIARRIGEEIELKYILVRHAYHDTPFSDRMVMNFSIIETDPEVAVVAEVIGGVRDAYEYTRRALLAGKSVVTSNKELVALHGAELNEIAREQGVSYLFEGSVGGGIPLLRPLSRCLAANRIDEVFGILNGTTNYILTAMDTQGQDFGTALSAAQELGYAEADPTADVEGIDACRKTAILADLAFGFNMDPLAIPTKGITEITPADLELAHALGYGIKLLGRAIRTDNGCCAFVEPQLVPQDHLLANVSGVMNACVVRTDTVGEVMFYGPGAGKRPTASAVAADIVDAVQHCGHPLHMDLGVSGGTLAPSSALSSRWYVRASASSDEVRASFPDAVPVYGASQECGFITASMNRRALEPMLAGLEIGAVLRVLD